jgi:uncharacterized protein YjhX (UPF0386 family)
MYIIIYIINIEGVHECRLLHNEAHAASMVIVRKHAQRIKKSGCPQAGEEGREGPVGRGGDWPYSSNVQLTTGWRRLCSAGDASPCRRAPVEQWRWAARAGDSVSARPPAWEQRQRTAAGGRAHIVRQQHQVAAVGACARGTGVVMYKCWFAFHSHLSSIS